MAAEKTIKVSPETYERLDTQARTRGLSIERFLDSLLQEFDKLRERLFIEHLRAEGLIVSFPPGDITVPRDFKPVPVKGEPVSQTIIEDRE
ncbi:MAG: hypothetical protein ONB44_22160 [candidate division KSB1 bacterium]|nr:hypothetical protein [candidate division KSB1 bacterium]MDZ7304841.1 hypothetical protein [candidate division KSB1 bacterium]MDZ7313921.1 hypothetical protein [candidate division KSB1 bacterium]